jgi:phosphoserine aminotransferase
MSTVFNFNPGPATLPAPVMRKAQSEFCDYNGMGFGIIEASHRSPDFDDVLNTAKANVVKLLNLSDDYEVLFLQGGASLQFAMLPMNFMVKGKPALYADTGSWTSNAIKEAKLLGDVKLVYDGKPSNYTVIGDPEDWDLSGDASYLYICSNNTIAGTQYHFFPETNGLPLFADMSSDILSRRIDVSKFAVIFAGAQKNLGPAGVTLVILNKALLERVPASLPTMLKYTTHIDKNSCFNTPPVFAIYMVKLVTDWMLEQGGLEVVERINAAKSEALYEAIDSSDFYRGTAEAGDRSKMNITFRLPTEDLEKAFVAEAKKAGLVGLKGHRSVGGIRASCYNAMPLEGVSRLVDFMHEFAQKNG